jgi:hypothetical protein
MTTLILPLPAAALGENRTHGRHGLAVSKDRNAYEDQALPLLRQQLGPPPYVPWPVPVRLTLTYVRDGHADLTQLASASKRLVDCLTARPRGRPGRQRVGVGLLVDDSPRYLPAVDLRWRRARPGEAPHVEVTLTAWADAGDASALKGA